MRTARLIPTLSATALALGLLVGCGGSSSTTNASAGSPGSSGGSSPGSSAGSSAGSSGSAGSGSGSGDATSSSGSGSSGGSGGGKAASCAAAPAAVVGAALGDTLGAPQETRNGDTIVVCDYNGPKIGLVKLRIQTDSSASAFAVDRKGFAAQKMATTDESLADEAFSNVLGKVTSLVARKGSVEILVSARASVAQEKALLGQLFSRI